MAVLPLRGAKDAPRISLPVSTGRLCLRDFAMTDFEAVHAWSSREEVTRYLIWGPNSKAQTREALRDFRRDQRRRPLGGACLSRVIAAILVLLWGKKMQDVAII